jgi:glucose-1-phosphate cytidylyltransferase
MKNPIPAVILAGGLGIRIREETEFIPKPMVEIGGRPILWHIMKHLSTYGISRFVICVGYKGDAIRDYFLNYRARNNDFTLSLGAHNELTFYSDHEESNWSVTIAETGPLTNTGGRVYGIKKYISGERFLCTYGDGLSDINIDELDRFQLEKNKIATVLAVKPLSRFGIMNIGTNDIVQNFKEKPQVDAWTNGGFFIFKPELFNYLKPNIVLENEPLQQLASENQLTAYKHDGFWQPMDTFKEAKMLNELWESGSAPWRIGK